MKIALATDHAGFAAVKELQSHLESLGHECVYYGPAVYDEADDYPQFIFAAARAVASGDCERGVIFGGSGQGEAMAANRIKTIRCTVFYGPVTASKPIDAEGHTSDDPYIILKLSREHNNANMLSLGARFLGMDEVKRATEVWLNEPAATAERHLRRTQQLDELS